MAKRLSNQKRARRVQLYAVAVNACCPFCGEPQPNQDGSEMWTPEDFMHVTHPQRACVSCDEPILVHSDPKASLYVQGRQ